MAVQTESEADEWESYYRDGNFGISSYEVTLFPNESYQNIVMNIGNLAARLKQFLETGEDPKEKKYNQLAHHFAKANEEGTEEKEIPNERWILLDAVDSGLSVDNVTDIKEQLFKMILGHNYENDIYIVISANAYEMARSEQCFDVYNGKYVKFADYEEYRHFVLKSKEWKRSREEAGMD